MSVQTKETRRVNQSEQAGYVLGPDEGIRMNAVGVTITFRATAADTGGRFALFEMTVPPHFDGPPPHWHKETAEAFFVLDGTVTAVHGQKRTPVPAGGCWCVPTAVVHTYANESDEPATFVVLLTPSDMEAYFFELVELVQEAPEWPPQDPETQAAVGELARRYDQHPPDTAPGNGSGQAIVRQPGEGRSLSIRGQRMTWKTVGEQTDGKIATLHYDGPADAPDRPSTITPRRTKWATFSRVTSTSAWMGAKCRPAPVPSSTFRPTWFTSGPAPATIRSSSWALPSRPALRITSSS